jgi:hypothetical protein
MFLIGRIVFDYFMRDMAIQTNIWLKILTFILGFYYYFVVVDGIYNIAQAIAQATKIGQ